MALKLSGKPKRGSRQEDCGPLRACAVRQWQTLCIYMAGWMLLATHTPPKRILYLRCLRAAGFATLPWRAAGTGRSNPVGPCIFYCSALSVALPHYRPPRNRRKETDGSGKHIRRLRRGAAPALRICKAPTGQKRYKARSPVGGIQDFRRRLAGRRKYAYPERGKKRAVSPSYPRPCCAFRNRRGYTLRRKST